MLRLLHIFDRFCYYIYLQYSRNWEMSVKETKWYFCAAEGCSSDDRKRGKYGYMKNIEFFPFPTKKMSQNWEGNGYNFSVGMTICQPRSIECALCTLLMVDLLKSTHYQNFFLITTTKKMKAGHLLCLYWGSGSLVPHPT